MQERGSLQLLFFAVGVFLINFNFSFPRIPKIASLLYFWVFVVKAKIEIFSKILDRFCSSYFSLFICRKIKTKIYLKILDGFLCTVWLYFRNTKISCGVFRNFFTVIVFNKVTSKSQTSALIISIFY